jgi:hypothetical protein
MGSRIRYLSDQSFALRRGIVVKICLQLILLVLKPEYFVLEIILEGIGMQTVISGSKLHTVRQIKFNADLIERVVTATTED